MCAKWFEQRSSEPYDRPHGVFVMSRSSVRVRQAAPKVTATKVALTSTGTHSDHPSHVPLGAALGRREPLVVSQLCPHTERGTANRRALSRCDGVDLRAGGVRSG